MSNPATAVKIHSSDTDRTEEAKRFAASNSYPFLAEKSEEYLQEVGYILDFSPEGIVLRFLENRKPRKLLVDFISGAKGHRRKYGGGKGQAIAKAVGLGSTKVSLRVIDATAGQGGDAFVLACLGCRITLVERSAVARVMLEDALNRARYFARDEDFELQEILDRMTLISGDFLNLSREKAFENCDVVYLDPMFPKRKKSALVKKEMRVFQDVVGQDDDSDNLLSVSLSIAKYRVVVKRPLHAPFLANEKPSFQLNGKSSRFDIYVNRSLKAADDIVSAG